MMFLFDKIKISLDRHPVLMTKNLQLIVMKAMLRILVRIELTPQRLMASIQISLNLWMTTQTSPVKLKQMLKHKQLYVACRSWK